MINCLQCPRKCGINRFDSFGYCHSGMLPMVSSVCIHHGEEPVISGKKGICNVFFCHCNLTCIYCQNHQISRNHDKVIGEELSFEELANRIISILDTGIDMLGFVSPSHFSLQMVETIRLLHTKGYFPTVVYNSNGYDDVETLRRIEGYIDIYLPDFKYSDSSLAARFSDATDYTETALQAIEEMYRQKGADLTIDKDGLARKGIIVRHLVLPGHIENSKGVLRTIAGIDPQLHLSLMAQYYPPFSMKYAELNRRLTESEYEEVLDCLDELGLENGWIQDLDSADNYQPDFDKKEAFKTN